MILNTRVQLRRTSNSIDSISASPLKEGEALFSTSDKSLVISSENGTQPATISARFFALDKQTKNTVYAGPSTGSNAYPSFRKLVANDLPTIPGNKISGKVTAAESADEASKLTPGGYLKVDLNSTNAAQFDGTSTMEDDPLKIGVEGVLPINKGGLGAAAADLSNFSKYGILFVDQSSAAAETKFIRTTDQASNPWQIIASSENSNYFKRPVWISIASTVNSSSRAPVDSSAVINYVTQTATANQAKKLETSRTIHVNLGSTVAAGFDGTQSIQPGVTGVLPIVNGGTGKSSFSSKSVVYIDSSNKMNSLTPTAANQIILSDANNNPKWKDFTSAFSDISWNNITSLENTYIWDTYSNGSWSTSLGTINSKSHGISGSIINLIRGSLADILFNRRIGSYQGNGYFTTNNISLTLSNSQTYLPRVLVITENSGTNIHRASIFIDTFNLTSNLTPTERLNNYGSAIGSIEWGTNARSIKITFEGEYGVDHFNQSGVRYLIYASE